MGEVVLLPCPFCGGPGAFYEDDGVWNTCGCASCSVGFHVYNQEEAVRYWNTRAAPPLPRLTPEERRAVEWAFRQTGIRKMFANVKELHQLYEHEIALRSLLEEARS